jgi:hypothetical protein
MLRLVADSENNGYRFDLIGIDANAHTIDYARELSVRYPNISYQCADVFSERSLNPNTTLHCLP